MKAITLWQPWASAMMRGVKQNETRSWPTSVQGDVAICSAKRKPIIADFEDEETYQFALQEPCGFVLCIVELFACHPAEMVRLSLCNEKNEAELDLGNYTTGRWAWRTRNLRPLKTPVPVIGRQGWFNLPADIERQVMTQLFPSIS